MSVDLSQQNVAALWEGTALSENDYKIDFETALGSGAAATIYYASRCTDAATKIEKTQPQEIVFKVINMFADKEAKELSMLKSEVSILADLQKHPNIVGFYGVCAISMSLIPNAERQLAIQMEYCAGGDLVSAVSRGRFPEHQAHSVVQEILGALAHIHSRGIVHRDVKPENVLQVSDECKTVKLTDFGISARLCDSKAMEKRCGSPGYVAPEVWLGYKYDVKVDTFSTGAVLYFTICGRGAFSGSCLKSVMSKTIHAPVNFRKSVCLERLSDECKAFVKTLLEKDPRHRPTACEALSNIWSLSEEQEPRSARFWRAACERESPRLPVPTSALCEQATDDGWSTAATTLREQSKNSCSHRSTRCCSQRTTNPRTTDDSEEDGRITFRSTNDRESRESTANSANVRSTSGGNSHIEGHDPILALSELDELSVLHEFRPSKPRKPMPAVRSPAMTKFQHRLAKLRAVVAMDSSEEPTYSSA